jgi:4-amino-4-deoxy-L-arabinose transferase-like glycosyltransferase
MFPGFVGETSMLIRRERAIDYKILLIAGLLPLYFLGLSNHGLWSHDEPRVAEIGREMSLTGRLGVPTLNQKPFLEKPPLHFWLLAATFKAFGRTSDGVARIPSAVLGLAGALAVFSLARMLFGMRIGLLSAFILSTSGSYLEATHKVLVDNALTCFVVCAMTAFVAGYSSERPRSRAFFYALFYLSSGLAFLSKGFVGLAFPGVGILAFLMFRKDLGEIPRMRPWLGIALLAALSLPWFLALRLEGGASYFRFFFIENHLHRFLSGGHLGHHKPLTFYIGRFPQSFFPWSLLLIPVLYRFFWIRKDLSHTPKMGLLFMKCWFISGFLFLSIASTKRSLYLLPILPPISILTAYWIDATFTSGNLHRMEKAFAWVFGLCILVAGVSACPYRFYLFKQWADPSLAHAALILVLCAVSLKFLAEKKTGPFWVSSCGATLFLSLFILLWIYPSMDRNKSYRPFGEEVKEAVGSNENFYAYKPHEALRSAVPFYTGRYVEEIYDRTLLEEIIARKEQVFVVAVNGRGKSGQEVGPGKELLSTGKVEMRVRREVGSYVWLLFTNRRAEHFGNLD